MQYYYHLWWIVWFLFKMKRIRSEENKKRRLENERKSEVVQTVSNFHEFCLHVPICTSFFSIPKKISFLNVLSFIVSFNLLNIQQIFVQIMCHRVNRCVTVSPYIWSQWLPVSGKTAHTVCQRPLVRVPVEISLHVHHLLHMLIRCGMVYALKGEL